MDVDRARVLASRLAGHGLAAPDRDPLATLGRWAVQDSPPGAAAAALLARGDVPPGWLDAALADRSAAALSRIWRATGGAGLALVDGAPAAVWSARKAGRILRATVEPIAHLPGDAVAAAFDRLAPHRGCESAAVAV